MKKKKIYLIIAIVMTLLLIFAGSYAYWIWNSDENKNIVFNTSSDLKDYIIYDEGESKFVGDFKIGSTYLDGVHTTISIYKTSEAKDVDMYATINMRINAIGDNLKNFSGLKWTLTEGNATSNGEVLASGNFIGYNINDTIELKTNIEVLTELKEYTVWLWLDQSENPTEVLTGETIDTSIWTQVDQMLDETFEILNIDYVEEGLNVSVINKAARITHYQFTSENIEPAEWIAIADDEIDYTYTLKYSESLTDKNYVWFRDEKGKIIKSLVDTVPPTAPTTMNYVFGDWSLYTDDTWTNKIVYVASSEEHPGPSGATDLESGIDKYQISRDNKTWEDYNYVVNNYLEDEMYALASNGTHIRYFRACDKAGNCGPSISRTAKIDRYGPYGRVDLSLNNGVYTVSLADYGDEGSGLNTTYGFSLISSGSCSSASYTNQTGTSKTYSGSYTSGTTYYGCIKLTDNVGNISYVNSAGLSYAAYSYTYSDIVGSYKCNNISAGSSPYKFTYTGNCQVVNSSSCATVSNDSNSYCIKFLTTGTFNTTKNTTVDIFLVGGGAGGNGTMGNGGGGGYTKTQKSVSLAANTNYSVMIGAGGASAGNGGSSVFDSYSVAGGNASGSGGSGGGNKSFYAEGSKSTAGSDGGNGGGGLSGQGTTTREFGVSNATLYAGGGAGYCSNNAGTSYIALNGGAGGGGNNGLAYHKSGGNGTANTGGGGGGGHAGAGSGGSGIVIIRNTSVISNSKPVSTITLTYNNNGGNGCHSKSITSGLTYGELCTPTRKDHIFEGWYTATTGGTKIESSTTVSTTSNQTLYARWISTIYPNVSFETDGNSSYVSGNVSSIINVSKGNVDLDSSSYKYIWSTSNTANPNTSFTSGNSYTLTDATGIYYLIAKACDMNGNCTTKASGAFYVDNSYPTGSVSAATGSNMINATLSVSDTGSGLTGSYGWKISTSNVCNASTTGFTNSSNKTYSFSISASGTYYVCAKVTDNVGHDSYIVSSGISATYTNPLSDFGYTGTYSIIENANGVMTIKLTSSGTLTLSANAQVDVALVGGGAGGGRGGKGGDGDPCYGGTGGGGGAVNVYSKVSLSGGTNYPITIGAGGATDKAGGDTTGFGLTAQGGSVDGGGRGAYLSGYVQGDSYGSLGGSNGTNVWNLGTYYGAGGGGASCYNSKYVYSSAHLNDVHTGGTTGGGTGGSESTAGTAGADNTGSGGGGGGVKAWGYCDQYWTCGTSYSGGAGGSGTVIIRNAR